MKVRKAFAEKVKLLRKEQELSQEKFAIKAGIDRTTLSHIELGRRNVSIDTMVKIANAFEIEVKHLF